MTIEHDGFLSPDVESWRRKHRTALSDHFELAHELNRFAQSLLVGATVTIQSEGADPGLVRLLLLYRLTSAFQATVLLEERGLVVEGRTMARSCLETLFHLAAVVRDPDIANKMVLHDVSARKKMGNWLVRRPNKDDYLVPSDLEKLEVYLEEVERDWPELHQLHMEDVANRGGLADMYIFYRQLSGDAAHPTLKALSWYVPSAVEGEVGEIRWGPDCDQDLLKDTLGLACTFLLAGLVAYNEGLGDNSHDAELSDVFDRYKRVIDVQT